MTSSYLDLNVEVEESTTDTETDHHPIWDLPGFWRNQFYAAAYFLSRVQQQQQNTDRPVNSSTPAETRKLLDSLALLFARAWGRAADTPANVTATALETVEVDRNSKNALIIHVVKNAGSQEIEGIEDTDFAKELSDWLQQGEVQDPSPSSGLWLRLVQFWGQRIKKYLRSLPHPENLENSLAELSEHYGKEQPSFTSDFGVMKQHVLAKETYKNDIPGCVFEMCFSLDDASETKYPKYQQPRKEQPDTRTQGQIQADKFRKSIKHIKLLRTLRDVWEGLARLRKENRMSTFTIRLLDAQPQRSLDMGEIVETMKVWKAPPDGNTKFQQDIEQVANHFTTPNNKVRRLNFHCELQILELCISSTNSKFEDYIGCSKLSCHLCWALLRNANYQTKGTHSVLHPDCSFPFQVSSAAGHYLLAASFKREQDRLLHRIMEYSMQPENNFTTYDPLSETDPYAQTRAAEVVTDNDLLWVINQTNQGNHPSTLTLEVLKLSVDGKATIENVEFYQISRTSYDDQGRLSKWVDDRLFQRFRGESLHCHLPDGMKDSSWVSEIQIQKALPSEEPVDGVPGFHHRRLQWHEFKILLDRDESVYAELQVLSQLCDATGAYLPANHFVERMVEDPLELITPFPFRGDVHVIGGIVVDNGIFVVPQETKRLSADYVMEFHEILQRVADQLTTCNIISRMKLLSFFYRRVGGDVQYLNLTAIPSQPSAREVERLLKSQSAFLSEAEDPVRALELAIEKRWNG